MNLIILLLYFLVAFYNIFNKDRIIIISFNININNNRKFNTIKISI